MLGIVDTSIGRFLHPRPLPFEADDLAFSPDGRRLAAANRDELRLWDVESGQEVQVLRPLGRRRGDNRFNPLVAWSGDGQRLAISNWRRTITIWDAAERQSMDTRAERRRSAEARAVGWHLTCAEDALSRHEEQAFRFHWRQLASLEPADATTWWRRGVLHARRGDLVKARRDCERAFAVTPPTKLADWMTLACFRVLTGDLAGARRLIQDAYQRFSPTASSIETRKILHLLLLVQNGADVSIVKNLAIKHAKARKDSGQPYFLYIEALTCYRQGQYEQALHYARRSLGTSPLWNEAFLPALVMAMVQHKMNQDRPALEALQTAVRLMDKRHMNPPNRLSGQNLRTWLEFQVLMREAHKMGLKE